jgi:hypothetical protein
MPRESEEATGEEARPPQMDDREGVPENVARGDDALHDSLQSGPVCEVHCRMEGPRAGCDGEKKFAGAASHRKAAASIGT